MCDRRECITTTTTKVDCTSSVTEIVLGLKNIVTKRSSFVAALRDAAPGFVSISFTYMKVYDGAEAETVSTFSTVRGPSDMEHDSLEH